MSHNISEHNISEHNISEHNISYEEEPFYIILQSNNMDVQLSTKRHVLFRFCLSGIDQFWISMEVFMHLMLCNGRTRTSGQYGALTLVAWLSEFCTFSLIISILNDLNDLKMIWMWIARWVVPDSLLPFLSWGCSPSATSKSHLVERTMAPKPWRFCWIPWCWKKGSRGLFEAFSSWQPSSKNQASFSCLPFLAANRSKPSIFSDAWNFRLGKVRWKNDMPGMLRNVWLVMAPQSNLMRPACISPNCGACTSPRPFQMRSTADLPTASLRFTYDLWGRGGSWFMI